MKRGTVRIFISKGGFVLLFPPLGQGRHGPGIECIRYTVIAPNARQVLRIECVPFDLIVFQRLRSITVVLTTRAVSPTRWRRDRRQGFAFIRVLTLCRRDGAKTQRQHQKHRDQRGIPGTHPEFLYFRIRGASLEFLCRNDSISHGCPPAYFLWMMPPA